jgi:hypothetical protein
MTPSQLSAELRRVASKLNASTNPSKELVVADLRRIIAKAVQSDEQYAAWAAKAQECWSEVKTCEEQMKTCMKQHNYAEAADHCGKMAKKMAEYGEMCTGNETFHSALLAEMEKSAEKPAEHGSH